MAKVKLNRGKTGYIFFKELGGAPNRKSLSKTASVLINMKLICGRVLDYGCGHVFDADKLGWDSYDPYYRPTKPTTGCSTPNGIRRTPLDLCDAALSRRGCGFIDEYATKIFVGAVIALT